VELGLLAGGLGEEELPHRTYHTGSEPLLSCSSTSNPPRPVAPRTGKNHLESNPRRLLTTGDNLRGADKGRGTQRRPL
jgi:hypothetical protein